MNRQYDIVVAGGGITGLMVGLLLARSRNQERLRITIVDAAPRPVFNKDDDVALRVSAIATGTAALLESVGAWQSVASGRIGPYDRMRVWDQSGNPDSSAALKFDAAEFAVPQLGFIVENVLLQHALLEQLDATNVALCFATKILSVQRVGKGIQLELADHQVLQPDLLIGADGARSFIRQSLGIETRDWPYGQTAVVTHLLPQHGHRDTAWQRFLSDGPLGILPLADGRVSVVWTTTQEQAVAAVAADDTELGRLLTEASAQVLGELTVAGARGAFPLCARHACNYVQPGVALIGDAAHAVHPLAGQGANLGLQDAAKLAAVIDEAIMRGEHPGDQPVLRRYERARKGANATMLHFMTGVNSLFTTDSAIVAELRAVGMRLFNRSGPIREHAVKVALGIGRR